MAVKKLNFSVALDCGRAHFVCAIVQKYSSPLSRVRWFIMLESDAIVYICSYYDSSNRKYLLQILQRITAASLYKTFINSFCLRSFRFLWVAAHAQLTTML